MTKANTDWAPRALLWAALGVAPATAAVAAERQLDAHEHGVTMLNIALEGTTLVAELEGPAMNFVGFEYTAATAEEKAAVDATLATLRAGEQVLGFVPAAACELESAAARLVTDADEDHDDHDEHDDHDDHDAEAEHAAEKHDDHEDHDDEGAQHSEFVAEYAFRCANPDALTAVQVLLFEQFELTDEVEASFVGPGLQTFGELTAGANTLSVER